MTKKINTDNNKDISIDKLLYADLTYKIRGCIFNVYNELGYGHKELVYQKALARELSDGNIPFKREKKLTVEYKGDNVGSYRPDFLIDGKVIIETKAVEFVPKSYENQLIHYLKTTDIKLGLLVNFGRTKLEIKRLVWTSGHWQETTNHPRSSVSDQRKSKIL